MASTAEQRFATSFLYSLSLKKTRYNSNFEPSLHSLGPALPPASRPFSLDNKESEEDYIPNEQKIDLKFKLLKTATTFELTVSPMEMIESLKQKVSNELEIPVDQLRLVCGGKGLNDGKTVTDYNLSSAQVIHVMRKPGTVNSSSSSGENSNFHSSTTTTTTTTNMTAGFIPIDPAQEEIQMIATDGDFWDDLNKILNKHWKEKSNVEMIRGYVFDLLSSKVKDDQMKAALRRYK